MATVREALVNLLAAIEEHRKEQSLQSASKFKAAVKSAEAALAPPPKRKKPYRSTMHIYNDDGAFDRS